MKRVFAFILFLTFFAFPMMAYESPITEPGAGNPTDMYTTTSSGPNGAPGPNKISGGAGQQESIDDPGTVAEGSPIGAPWVLLGFAAAYAGVRLVRKKE